MHGTYVTLASYDHLEEAVVAKGRLESANIDCFLADEHIARHCGIAVGGVKLKVAESDVEIASELLSARADICDALGASLNDDEADES